MKRRWLLWLLTLLFAWVVISRRAEVVQVAQTLGRGHWEWVLAAAALQMVYYLVVTALYQSAFDTVEVASRFGQLLPVAFVSIFMDCVAPLGGTSGVVIYVDDAGRRGESPARASAGALLVLIANYGALLVLLVVGMIILAMQGDLKLYEVMASAALLALTAGLVGVLVLGRCRPNGLRRLLAWVERLAARLATRLKRPSPLGAGWAERHTADFSAAATHIAGHPLRVVRTVSLGLVLNLSAMASLWALFLGFSQPAHLSVLVAGFSMCMLFWAISITPQGIGVVEAVTALVFISQGMPATAAAAITLAYRGLAFWLPLLVGFVLVRTVPSFRLSKPSTGVSGLADKPSNAEASRESLTRAARPAVSVVIPAYNEEARLAACLEALRRQDYDGPYEIVVVNNASTDRTPEIARALGARVVDEPHKGNVHALRAGFAAAKGEIIARTDADSRVPRDWLTRLIGRLTARPGVVAAGGIFAFDDGPAWLRYGSRLVLQLSWHLLGVNMAVWRWAYDAVGGFDPVVNFGEDADLGLRMKRLGQVTIDRRLVVGTSARRFEADLWRTLWMYWAGDLAFALGRRPWFHVFADIRIVPRRRGARLALAGTGISLAAVCFLTVGALSPGAQVFGQVVAHGQPDQPLVALTFEDGPSSYTAQVLDILDRYGVKATFFVIGENVDRRPDLVRRIVGEGNAVGNHSYSHTAWGALESSSDIEVELAAASAAVERATGVAPTLFRPPYGCRSPWMMRVAREAGYQVVTWNVDAGDETRPSPQVIARRVLRRVQPGAIVLLHDGLDRQADPAMQNTVQALPAIIEGLQAQGYRLVTVPELIAASAAPPEAVPLQAQPVGP